MTTSASSIPMKEDKTEFRTCPQTFLKVDIAAERLIMANSVVAIVCLLLGGILALLLALTRWQAIHLLDPVWFYRSLTAHGIDMLVAWIVFFEVAGLYFGSTVMLNSRMVAPGVAWFAFGLMVVGGALVNVVVFLGWADVMFTSYVPLKAHPLFYLSYILFAVGALVAVILFFINIWTARREKTYEGSLPLVVFGLVTAGILAVYTLLQGAAAMVPAFLWSLDLLPTFNAAVYRNFFWGFGHPAQQVNLAAMVAVWYALAAITVGAKPVNEKLSRFAFICYLFFINLGSAHHLLVDPGMSFAWKTFNTSYGMYLAVLGSLIHAFSIPAAVEVAQRIKGFGRGTFEWLRKGPWREPGFGALVVSMVVFGWIGGVTGVTIGTEQINMTAHNTLRLPGHFHATVVAGTTLAFMGLTYYLIPLIFRKDLKFKRLATWQPYVFGLGMVLFSTGMIVSGLQGLPRRSWDISYANALFPAQIPGTAELSLAVMGIGAVIGVIGGIMFMLVVLTSVFTGERKEASSLLLVTGTNNPLVESISVTEKDMEKPSVRPRGTFIIAIAFL
ncbi:MAG: cbb3-type cytochrome c oxidase subunit I, partial [Anaerolineales bacterium]|nr:cbb3-type cytochrome c oxidase subunit I [Anaerolineales bacterium]